MKEVPKELGVLKRAPTVSIYQNADHVAGILQQVHQSPLLTSERRETEGRRGRSSTSDFGIDGGTDVTGGIPFIGKARARLRAKRSRSSSSDHLSASRSSQDFVYSQAYYLDLVKNALDEAQLIKTVKTQADAQLLKSGDFVEYEATFRANELTSLLDILTPELIAAITYYSVRNEGIKRFEAFDDFEALKRFSLQNTEKADIHADLARAIATAVRVDFRSEHTREYYGAVGKNESLLTAVTICDNTFFVVDDEDRILDGRFTVLGKVTSEAEQDVPVLSRNKLLERLKPDAVDDALADFRQTVSGRAKRLEGRARGGEAVEHGAADDLIDLAFSSRVEGLSFNVIPIAIYA